MTLTQEQDQVLALVMAAPNKRDMAVRLQALLEHFNLQDSLEAFEKYGWRVVSHTPATHPHVQAVLMEGSLSALDPLGSAAESKCHVVLFTGGPERTTPYVPLDELIDGEDWHPVIWELLVGIREGIEQFVPLQFTESQIQSFKLQTCSQVRAIECAYEHVDKALEDLQLFRGAAPELEDFSRIVKSLVEDVTPLLEPVQGLIQAFAKLRDALSAETVTADVVTALNVYNFWTKLRMGEAKKAVGDALEWARWLPRRLLLGLLYEVHSLRPCLIKEEELWLRTDAFHGEWKRLEAHQTLIDQVVGGLQKEVFHEEIVQLLQPVRTTLHTFLQKWRQLWAHSLESRWIEYIHLDIKALKEAQAQWNDFLAGYGMQELVEQLAAYLDAQQYAGQIYEAVCNLRALEPNMNSALEPQHTSVQVRKIHEWNDYLFYQLGVLHRLSETNPPLRKQLREVNRVIQPLVDGVEAFIEHTSSFLENVASGAHFSQPHEAEQEMNEVVAAYQSYNRMFPDQIASVKAELDVLLWKMESPKIQVAYAKSYFSVREWLWQTLQEHQAEHVLLAAGGQAVGLAQLAAMDLRPCRFYTRTPAVVEVYTFGESRLGDEDFVSAFEAKVEHRYHVAGV